MTANESQNISISGSNVSNIQIGGQAGRDLSVQQNQQVSATDELSAPAEVSTLLLKIKELLESSDLSDGDKEKAIRGLDNALDETKSDKPDKDFAAKSLKRTTDVLKSADATVEAGTNLWKKVSPIVDSIKPWLGAAISFLG